MKKSKKFKNSMQKKSSKIAVSEKELSQSELQKLAHAGTKEAVEKIEKYIKTEKDYEKHSYAEMALEECEFMFYQPKNEKEEEDFMLCVLIMHRQRNVDDLIMRADTIRAKIEKLMLEKKVHEKVLAAHKNKKEAWQYNWMQDFVGMEEEKMGEIEDEMAYDEAWVVEAKKMITTPRYKNIPVRHLEHFDFNFGEDFENDDEDCFDCDDDCSLCDVAN